MKRTLAASAAGRAWGWVVATSLYACSSGCSCEDTAPKSATVPKLTSEDQQTLDVDRIRFTLHTPEDYAKEAFLAIDEDNVRETFERLRREIETDDVISGPAQPAPSASTPR